MTSSLVGSEMCIRDSRCPDSQRTTAPTLAGAGDRGTPASDGAARGRQKTVSYTHLTLPTICSV
eukprot:7081438-Prorocentrum_lima.AAC.1